MPWSGLEAAAQELANDWNTVGPVKSDSANVEDGGDGNVRSKSDQVDSCAPEYGEPNSDDWSVGARVDDLPVLGARKETVAREGKDGTGKSLNGDDAERVENDESADGVDNSTVTSKIVVENLNDRLLERAGQDICWITHDKSEDDGKEPTHDVGQSHGDENSPRSLGLWLVNLLSDVSGRIVVGHGPRNGKETEQERPADRVPARLGVDEGENVRASVTIRAHGEESNGAGQDDQTVEDNVAGGDLGEPFGRERVDYSVEDGHTSLDGDSVASGWGV